MFYIWDAQNPWPWTVLLNQLSKYKVQISVQINMNIDQTEPLIGQKVDKGLMFKNRSWL